MPVDKWNQYATPADPWDEYATTPAASVPPAIKAASSGAGGSWDDEPVGQISAAPTGVLPWLNRVENDIRYGTDTTGPGKVLKWLGAPGVNRGVSEGAANEIAGPILGPVNVAKGVAESPDHPILGPLHAVGGILQTISPALNFVAPEAGEAATEASAIRTGMLRRALRQAERKQLRSPKTLKMRGRPFRMRSRRMADRFQARSMISTIF